MSTENKIECPALHKRSSSYPFGDRVPRTVRMLKTVTADPMPGIELAYIKGDAPVAEEGQTYPVWTNSHGAVTAIMEDGTRLGLRPAEFEVDSWHDLAAEPAPQHPDPIAWMVGTAFWWTKEEAERDAKTTGLAVVPVGPMVDTAEVERLESRIETQRESIRSHVQEVDRLRVLEIKYGLKIEERNDLLRKCLEWITSARDGVLYPIARDFEGVVGRNAEGLGQTTPALIDAIGDALSARAEPSAPLPPVDGDLLPSVGSKVLIHLGREDEWVEHTVVGYYVWENLRPDPSVHRVCVRVRDADGYLNARGLGDIRPVALESES